MEGRKNLCAMIPDSLHAKVRQEQEEKGIKLSDYIEQILNEHFNKVKGGTDMNQYRTMALQIPEELFIRLKSYLAKEGISQKQFVIDLITQALDADDAQG